MSVFANAKELQEAADNGCLRCCFHEVLEDFAAKGQRGLEWEMLATHEWESLARGFFNVMFWPRSSFWVVARF